MPRINYKPLAFDNTLRNPERIKTFLKILKEYEGQVLTNDIMLGVSRELVALGHFKPTRVSTAIKDKWRLNIKLNNSETQTVLRDNPQNHTEAGFDHGWPSRFDTWYKFPKELGLVWYAPGEEIAFSPTSTLLLDDENPQYETLVFANALSKYYRNNPFRRVLNTGRPLRLLLKTIALINADDQFNQVGITKRELAIMLCWQDEDATGLYETLVTLRKQHGYSPSNEVILAICRSKLDGTIRNSDSLLNYNPDEFIRKIRLTGLISIRGGGRFIDINAKEAIAVDYIINNAPQVSLHPDERAYFEYMSTVDDRLTVLLAAASGQATRATNEELDKWVGELGWGVISHELILLAGGGISHHETLKLIDGPLRLEFLTSLGIHGQLPDTQVTPNYTTDDEGLPTSFAAGGKPDIVCKQDGKTALVEVTLLKGVQQHIRESYSVKRHLQEYQETDADVFSILLTPAAFTDTVEHAEFVRSRDKLDVRVIDIPDFVRHLDAGQSLNNLALHN